MEGWKIQRDRTKCEEPGCPLPAAEEYFAVLEVPECVRRDLCAMCFHRIDKSAADAPIFWKCRRRVDGQKGPVLDLVALRMLFDRLAEVDDDKARGLRYFVALLLLRKRLLKMVDAMNEEQERADLVVIDPKVEGMAPVALFAPALDEERLANLETELMDALAAGDEEPEVEAAAEGEGGEG